MPMGGIKSAVGIGTLLAEGIGDTIRVSLTDDPVEEVKAGTTILQSLGLRKRGLDLVACPSCGRAEVNVLELTQKVNAAIEQRAVHGADAGRGHGLRRERARRGARGRRRHRERQRARVHHPPGRGRREGARGRARRGAAHRGAGRRGREGRRRRGRRLAVMALQFEPTRGRRYRTLMPNGRPRMLVAAAVGRSSPRPPVVPAPDPLRRPRCPARPARSSRPTTSGTWTSRRCPKHPKSDGMEAASHAGLDRLHPDFGPPSTASRSTWSTLPHADVAIDFGYADESDPGPYPFGPDTTIEGGSDRHALMVDRGHLRALRAVRRSVERRRSHARGAARSSISGPTTLRPAGWTSADAAGLPIFPGLVRWDEVQAGVIEHAIRFTVDCTMRRLPVARAASGRARRPAMPADGRPVPAQGRVRHLGVRAERAGRAARDASATA